MQLALGPPSPPAVTPIRSWRPPTAGHASSASCWGVTSGWRIPLVACRSSTSTGGDCTGSGAGRTGPLRGRCPSRRRPRSTPGAVQLSLARCFQGRAEESLALAEQALASYPTPTAIRRWVTASAPTKAWLPTSSPAGAIPHPRPSGPWPRAADPGRRPGRGTSASRSISPMRGHLASDWPLGTGGGGGDVALRRTGPQPRPGARLRSLGRDQWGVGGCRTGDWPG